MTRTEATEVLALVTAAYPRAEMSDPTVEVWIASLVKLDFARTRRAVELLVGELIFPPTVADVRKRYDDLARQDAREQQAERSLVQETRGPLPSKEQQLANVRRVKTELAKVGRGVPDDEQETR